MNAHTAVCRYLQLKSTCLKTRAVSDQNAFAWDLGIEKWPALQHASPSMKSQRGMPNESRFGNSGSMEGASAKPWLKP